MSGGKVPEQLVNEWKTLLVAGKPLNKRLEERSEVIAEVEGPVEEVAALLDDKEMERYLNGESEWGYKERYLFHVIQAPLS